MLVRCPTCGKTLKVDDQRVTPEGAKFKCPGCTALFLVRKPVVASPPSAVSEVPVKAPEPPPPSREEMFQPQATTLRDMPSDDDQLHAGDGGEEPPAGDVSVSYGNPFAATGGEEAPQQSTESTEEGSWGVSNPLSTDFGLSGFGVAGQEEESTGSDGEPEPSMLQSPFSDLDISSTEFPGPSEESFRLDAFPEPSEEPIQPPPIPPPDEEEKSGVSVREIERAKRLARTIMSDIALYNSRKVEDSIRDDTFFDVMGEDLREGMKLYNSRIPPEVRAVSDFYREAVEEYYERKRTDFGLA